MRLLEDRKRPPEPTTVHPGLDAEMLPHAESIEAGLLPFLRAAGITPLLKRIG